MRISAASRSAPRVQPEFERVHALVEALKSPACYPHPVRSVRMLETHISWVLLAGDYAYKVKKPVDLGFVDFRTPEQRRFCCEEELRLNRRTAPNLYLDVVPIAGRPEAPTIGGTTPALEHAVRMRRFEQEALFDRLARGPGIEPRHIDALACEIARFHASLAGKRSAPARLAPARAVDEALRNFDQIQGCAQRPLTRSALATLRAWTAHEARELSPWFAERDRGGFVRECHGDLHLGNIALVDGEPIAFDCIEFNASLRWIDVANEIAFTVMDLIHHGCAGLAFRLLNAWLQETGDYGALPGLRFYLVYRAMVRAKVAALRRSQPGIGTADRTQAQSDSEAFVQLATKLSRRGAPALVLMHGLSGSGKTTISQALLEHLGAIRLRSDVERKRLHGLAADARTQSAPGAGLYTRSEGEKTYAHLASLARVALAAGYPAIVDAAFLRRSEREPFAALARALGVPFAVVDCDVPEAILRERVAQREREGADASEAGLAVLELQLASNEPLAGPELAGTVRIDASRADAPREACAALSARLGVARP